MNLADLRKYLDYYQIFKKYRIRCLGSGLANRNFLIQVGGRKYNLRTNRLRPPVSKQFLFNEHVFLKFAQQKKIPFVSRSFYYDIAENIHIVEFLPGKKLQMRHMGKNNLAQSLSCLNQVNALAPDFLNYLKKHKIVFSGPRSRALIRREIEKNIGFLKEPDYQGPVRWVKERLKKDWGRLDVREKEVYLNHGDPVSNIVLNKGRLFLIDWERVCFSFDPGLAYIWLHGFLDDQKREQVVEIYAALSGGSLAELRKQTVKKFKLLLIENIISLCKVTWRNRKMFDPRAKLDQSLIRGRMKFYDYVG